MKSFDFSASGAPAPRLEDAGASSPEAAGRLTVSTAPQRSKMYIDGVYYGLTPLSVDLAPGVYEVTLKQKGFRPVTEKVSIRQDGTTELEAELEKE